MRLTGSPSINESIQVPSAFESALAGIFLAAELAIQHAGLRANPILNVTKLNLIRPITSYSTNEFAAKDTSGRCICQDSVYANQYKRKWKSIS